MADLYRDIESGETFTEAQLLEIFTENSEIYADEYGDFETWFMAQMWQSGGNLEAVV